MTPLRFKVLDQFIESAKDMGDANMIAVGRRLWWSMSFPRTKGHVASNSDRKIFNEWVNA